MFTVIGNDILYVGYLKGGSFLDCIENKLRS